VAAREAMNRLRREGWMAWPGKGSHVIFKKDGRRVVVSNHAGEIPRLIVEAEAVKASHWMCGVGRLLHVWPPFVVSITQER